MTKNLVIERAVSAVLAVSMAGALAACGGETASPSGTDTGAGTEAIATEQSQTAKQDSDGVTFDNSIVRAKPAADAPEGNDMTAIFGTLHNHTGGDVTLTGFSSSLGDARYEIHEVVDGIMRQKDGGVTIPAGGSVEFKPGAEHLMVMDYTPEIPAGSTVTLTFEFADGTAVEIPDVAVRTMGAGHEEYGHGGELQGHKH